MSLKFLDIPTNPFNGLQVNEANIMQKKWFITQTNSGINVNRLRMWPSLCGGQTRQCRGISSGQWLVKGTPTFGGLRDTIENQCFSLRDFPFRARTILVQCSLISRMTNFTSDTAGQMSFGCLSTPAKVAETYIPETRKWIEFRENATFASQACMFPQFLLEYNWNWYEVGLPAQSLREMVFARYVELRSAHTKPTALLHWAETTSIHRELKPWLNQGLKVILPSYDVTHP